MEKLTQKGKTKWWFVRRLTNVNEFLALRTRATLFVREAARCSEGVSSSSTNCPGPEGQSVCGNWNRNLPANSLLNEDHSRGKVSWRSKPGNEAKQINQKELRKQFYASCLEMVVMTKWCYNRKLSASTFLDIFSREPINTQNGQRAEIADYGQCCGRDMRRFGGKGRGGRREPDKTLLPHKHQSELKLCGYTKLESWSM